jgi:murein DD-endopeptidase MepM/ murein hydrolase activator NlpD
MEFQLHPASRKGAVRTLVLGPRGEKLALFAAGLAALLAVSLWITVPAVAGRALQIQVRQSQEGELAEAHRVRLDLEARVRGLRDRAQDAGDLVSRIAFLYGVAPSRWPRSLNPETGLLARADPVQFAQGLDRYLVGLERARATIAEAETADPGLPGWMPARLPVQSDMVEPSAVFGPRVSPWTGAEEFFPGLELAAPAGSPVIAPAGGTVVFAGRSQGAASSRLRRFGNLVVLTHGPGGLTLFGHLARVDVKRGERVRAGQRLGTVGATGWAMAPALHYEYWRNRAGRLVPTDPQFVILDRRLSRSNVSLEKMTATSAPGTIEPPPGR